MLAETSEVDYQETCASVIRKLEHREVNVDLVTMPDSFLDHTLTYKQTATALAKRIVAVAAKGGGEIPDAPQRLEIGGNAAICSIALSRLGATVHPIMKTSELGLLVLKRYYKGLRVDTSHVKTDGNLAPTLILELGYGKKVRNVMVGDSSSVSEFGFDELSTEDLNLLTHADTVCVFNWLYNRKGTELAEGVFRYCKQNSKARTFFDPADPWPRRAELPELAKRVLQTDTVDSLGINENEAILIARVFHKGMKLRRGSPTLPLKAGRIIAAATNAEVFIHTAAYSAAITRDSLAIAPTFKVLVRRGTGAGDSWNAGILLAESLGLKEEEKLLFANAVAARYISRENRDYASLSDIARFVHDSDGSLNSTKLPGNI